MNSCDILSHPYRNSLIGVALLMGSIPAHASATYQFETSPIIVGAVQNSTQYDVKTTAGSLTGSHSPISIGQPLFASLTFASPLAPSSTTHLSAESSPGGRQFDLIGNNGPTQGNVEAYSTSVVYSPDPITSNIAQYFTGSAGNVFNYSRYSTLAGDITTDASGKISTWDLTFTLLKAPGGNIFAIDQSDPPKFVGPFSPSQEAADLHISSDPGSSITIHNVVSINGASQSPMDYIFNGKDAAFVDPGTGQQFRYYAAPIPEPSAWALMIAGLGLVGWQQRRLRRD